MKTITIDKDETGPIVAQKSNITWVLGKDATITIGSGETAFDAGSGHRNREFVIKGEINGPSDLSYGVVIGTEKITDFGGAHVRIAKSGEINAGAGVFSTAADSVIENAGRITGGVGIASSGAGSSIHNTGQISATDTGISFGLGDQVLTNDGSISAQKFGIGAFFDVGQTGTIINNGTITGVQAGIFSFGPGRVVIENHGTIIGGSYAAIGGLEGMTTEIVRNRGEISGDVVLRHGNDVYDGRDGTVGGKVFGGDNNDTYWVDNMQTTLVENADEGFDRVKAEISWTLADNFENLTLLGKNALSGTGNADANRLAGNVGNNLLNGAGGADILDGAAGNDRLTGGSQADIFVFRTGGDHDRIMDFEDGVDTIDLSHIKGIDSFADVSAGITAKGGDLFLHFGHGDVLRIDNIDKAMFTEADVLL